MVSINISYDVIAGGIRNIFIPDTIYFPAKPQGYLLFERECLEVRLCVKSTSLYLGPSNWLVKLVFPASIDINLCDVILVVTRIT